MHESLPLDFHPSIFCGEARKGYGEDCWCYGFDRLTGMIAVFDGCGGSGAKRHDAYRSHTEAYMASRLCAGVMYECIQESFPWGGDAKSFVRDVLTPWLKKRIQDNVPPESADGIKIKGMRTLPSTMAAALIQLCGNGTILLSPIWVGDSRVYILDASGLSQLTADDTNQPDPMEGLYDDGTLTNAICADRPFKIHCRTLRVRPPFMVIAASDGCFGYVSTPMEFEGMLLHTMLESDCVAQWEENLQQLIASYAGDDHTLCLASFGFGSYKAIKAHFAPRYDWLQREHLETVWNTPWEDRDTRRRLWAAYRQNYMKYLESEK